MTAQHTDELLRAFLERLATKQGSETFGTFEIAAVGLGYPVARELSGSGAT